MILSLSLPLQLNVTPSLVPAPYPHRWPFPTSALSFLLHTEFTKTTDKDILTGFQFGFDAFKEGFHTVYGLMSGEVDFRLYCIYDVCFGQCCHVLCLSVLVDIDSGGDGQGWQTGPMMSSICDAVSRNCNGEQSKAIYHY